MPIQGESRRRDANQTRLDLLSATRRLITEHGVNGVSTRMIGQAAGVNQALVYRYFGSKEALVSEAVEARSPALHDAIRAASDDDLARIIVEQVIAGTDPSEASMLAVLVAASDNEKERGNIRAGLESVFGEAMGDVFGDDEDARLKGEILGALTIGISVLRTVMGTEALKAASTEDLVPYVQRVLDALKQQS